MADREIDVIRTNDDGLRERFTFRIPAACDRIVVDPDDLHGSMPDLQPSVWGFIGEGGDGHSVEGVLLRREDYVVLG
jgi:hypothetical protein